MQKANKKYIPFLVFFFLLFFTWIEEVVIGEGYFSNYLHLPEHKFLHFLIRGIYAIIIFVVGYIGLANLSFKWVKILWIYLYVFAAIAAGLRVAFDVYFSQYFNGNFWSFLSTVYAICESPFPYIFLMLLAIIAKKNQSGI